MARCEICGKSVRFGHNVSHAKNRTRRTFQPNVHSAIFVRNGAPVRVKACTRCIRTQYKTARAR